MSKKLKIAIVCDKWKTHIFETILNEKSYVYELIENKSMDVFQVQILESELLKLKKDVQSMQDKARQSKMN